MADLSSATYKQLKDSRPKMVTIGNNGELEDGDGNDTLNVENGKLSGFVTGSINDDNVGSIDLSASGTYNKIGCAIITTYGGTAIVHYNFNGAGTCAIVSQHGDFWNTYIGNPGGASGNDSSVNIFCETDGSLHIENRYGTARDFTVHILARLF